MQQVDPINIAKSRRRIISILLFFVGIVVSIWSLFTLPTHDNEFGQAHISIPLTFLTGLVAIYLTATSVKQTVVYLEQKKDNKTMENEVTNPNSQLQMSSINNIIKGGGEVAEKTLHEICVQLKAAQGALYLAKNTTLELKYGFALTFERNTSVTYEFGEGIAGRVAKEGTSLYIDQVPEGYITVFSGLGSSSPTYLAVIPIKNQSEVKGIIEIALFNEITPGTVRDLEQTGRTLAEVI